MYHYIFLSLNNPIILRSIYYYIQQKFFVEIIKNKNNILLLNLLIHFFVYEIYESDMKTSQFEYFHYMAQNLFECLYKVDKLKEIIQIIDDIYYYI